MPTMIRVINDSPPGTEVYINTTTSGGDMRLMCLRAGQAVSLPIYAGGVTEIIERLPQNGTNEEYLYF